MEQTGATAQDIGAQAANTPPSVLQLAAHIRRVYSVNSTARSKITSIIRECQMAAESEYSPEQIAAIREAGGSEAYVPVTEQKIHSAVAWLKEILTGSGDRIWTIDPTPEPDLDDGKVRHITMAAMEEFQRMQAQNLQMTADDAYQFAQDMRQELFNITNEEAKKAAEKMAVRIDDILQEGGFQEAMFDFIDNLCRYPAAFMRMVQRMETKLEYDENSKEYKEIESPVTVFERVNPVQVFPAPAAKTVNDSDLVEVITMSKAELFTLTGLPGYSEENIRAFLSSCNGENGAGGAVNRIYPEAEPFNSQIDQNSDLIVGMEYWGNVSGAVLKEWGMTAPELDDVRYYSCHAILVKEFVIFAELNKNIKKSRHYYSAAFSRNPDSVHGKGIAQLIFPSQKSINGNRRAMENNIALSSGPQVMLDTKQVQNSSNPKVLQLYPWKVWPCEYSGYQNTDPVKFVNVPCNLEGYLRAAESFKNEADENSWIPRFAQGNAQGAVQGAAGTATGLLTLMNAATKQIREPLSNIDKGMIEPVIQDVYYMLMRDPAVPQDEKGDYKIKSRGAIGMSIKEQMQIRRQEFTQLVLNSQILQGILKPEGVVKLVRELVKTLDMPVDALVPTDAELRNQQEQAQQQNNNLTPELQQAMAQIDQQAAAGQISPQQAQQAKQMIVSGNAGIPQNAAAGSQETGVRGQNGATGQQPGPAGQVGQAGQQQPGGTAGQQQ